MSYLEVKEKFITEYWCSKHGQLSAGETSCPYCDKCEHGATLRMHCDACHDHETDEWKSLPLNDEEIEQLHKELIKDNWWRGPYRSRPKHYSRVRYFRSGEASLWALLLRDYMRLRHKPDDGK